MTAIEPNRKVIELADDERGANQVPLSDLWVAEATEFFTSHPADQMTEGELATVDLRDEEAFPRTMAGFRAWKAAADNYSHENPVPESEGDPAPAGSAGKTYPIPPAIKRAVKTIKGKATKTPADRAAFIKAMRANTSPGVLE